MILKSFSSFNPGSRTTTTPLPNTPISPLRQKLTDDMTMRHFSVATQRNYIPDVGRFASFPRRPPDTATAEDVCQFQLAQSETGVPVPTMNSVVSALRFFLDRPDLDAPDFGAAFDRFADRRVVPLGESSHGTSEFYRARHVITRRLVERHGFKLVAVKANWLDTATMSRYQKC